MKVAKVGEDKGLNVCGDCGLLIVFFLFGL